MDFGSRYRLERELGQGAMATVYQARDLLHQREVAIKVIRADLASILGPGRFLREIRIASQLNHPHILPLLDSGEIDGRPYYVMPVARGETLRSRLDRERQLGLEDALQITRGIADALHYAHQRGIVHRDIKPENILLDGEQALVADFGIARVADTTGDPKLSSSGIAIGTPAYMSPEQASAERTVDGRTDIYSLGCVLYEMLAGERLFSGPSAQVIAKRHMHEKVPSLALTRPDLPPWVQGVVEKSLAKTAADRYPTGAQLIAALDERKEPERTRTRRPAWRSIAIVALLAALTVSLARWLPAWLNSDQTNTGAGIGSLDSSRFLVVPFEHRTGAPADLNEDELLREALGLWSGISVVEGFQIREAMGRRKAGPLSTAELRRMARDAGAGRAVRGEVLFVNDSIRIHAVLYDAGRGQVVQEGTVRLALGRSNVQADFTSLANQLLLGSKAPQDGSVRKFGTVSLPALEAFGRGKAAIDEWNLALADSGFTTALRYDPGYPQAALWLAQVRAWRNAPSPDWQFAIERAVAGKEKLAGVDRTLSDALLALNRGEFVRACGLWKQLTAEGQFDFAIWYGLGTCLARDRAVIRDAASPSKWRFRSSYYSALRSLQRAFEILPSTHKGFRGDAFENLRRLLQVADQNQVRIGRALPPDTLTFGARPSSEGDSLVWIPYPLAEVNSGRVGTTGPGIEEGRVILRQMFFAITRSWAAAYPQSPDAVEAVGIALDLLGSSSAVDSIRRARSLATEPVQKARLGAAEVWLRLKAAVPYDTVSLASARALADSVLRVADDSLDRLAVPLMSLAALTGRALLAARLSRSAAIAAWGVGTPLSESAPPLLTLAAFGGPVDSLREMGRRLSRAIAQGIGPSDRLATELEWLGRSATLAFPAQVFPNLEHLIGHGDYVLDAQFDLLHGDTNAVRKMFRELAKGRVPQDVPFDALYVEARLLSAAGDSAEAINWLDPSLGALQRVSLRRFTADIQAVALVRSMVLRADLAMAAGASSTAAAWARVVIALWSSADPSLRATVDRMARIARQTSRG